MGLHSNLADGEFATETLIQLFPRRLPDVSAAKARQASERRRTGSRFEWDPFRNSNLDFGALPQATSHRQFRSDAVGPFAYASQSEVVVFPSCRLHAGLAVGGAGRSSEIRPSGRRVAKNQ